MFDFIRREKKVISFLFFFLFLGQNLFGGLTVDEASCAQKEYQEDSKCPRDKCYWLKEQSFLTHPLLDGGSICVPRCSSPNNCFIEKTHEYLIFLSENLNKRNFDPKKGYEINLNYLKSWDSYVDSLAMGLHFSWGEAIIKKGRQPKRNPPEGRCSGESWTVEDEGYDVAIEIANEEEEYRKHDDFQEVWEAEAVWGPDNRDNIGLMIVEKREDIEEASRVFLYIRYLIGSPEHKGAGSALMRKAKEIAKNLGLESIRVDAAGASMGWYKRKGFEERETLCDHQTPGRPCGCVSMEFRILVEKG